MDSSGVQLSVTGHLATITIGNEARHNALSAQDIDTFVELLKSVEDNDNIRVLIITGSGQRTFCAGASLNELSSGDLNGNHFETLTDQLTGISVPTIAAMNGSAYGGGAEVGLCCDFRIGVRDMKLFVPPARLGLCYPINGIQRYVQRLGLHSAKRLLVASEEFNTEQLLAMDYLTHLVEPDELHKYSKQMAEQIAALAPLAVKTMKALCNQTADGTIDQDQAAAAIAHCNASEDLQEGLRARQEKRTPLFTGN